jgi:hypothetical protein
MRGTHRFHIERPRAIAGYEQPTIPPHAERQLIAAGLLIGPEIEPPRVVEKADVEGVTRELEQPLQSRLD